jgi:hypothetical protein
MINNKNDDAPPPQSPWKKPKIVSLSKTKQLKRKSELIFASLSTNSLQNNNKIDQDPINSNEIDSKRRKTFNKFSTNNEYNNNEDKKVDANGDLYSFFANNEQTNEEIFTSTTTTTTKTITSISDNVFKTMLSSNGIHNLHNHNKNEQTKEKEEEEEEIKEKSNAFESHLIPIDWSLKTRARFISTQPFSCYGGIKSSHESEGISNYLKFNTFYKNLESSQYVSAIQTATYL